MSAAEVVSEDEEHDVEYEVLVRIRNENEGISALDLAAVGLVTLPLDIFRFMQLQVSE